MATTAQININVSASQAQTNVNSLSESIANAGNTAASLKAQLRQVTQELQNLEPGSARFQELSQRAGQLKDQIQDTSAVISATAGNAIENFGTALGNTIQIGVAGFQALNAAQVLFGTENEEVNKSIQQMTALLNLSQAIQTFGGLGDKLVQIKAGFQPLLASLGLVATTQTQVAVSTATADAALVAEGVAAEGAAVSTGFLATALNAIPFVAIATAVGLLAYNLLSAGDNTEKAAEEQEKLRKETEEYTKKVDEENQKIGESAGSYLQLVFQLKNTNVNSKERVRLINEINSTYGTTFKNLQNETEFQNQLNLSVKEYIALQVLKARQQSKEKEAQKAIGELIKAQDQLNKFEREYAGMSEKQISDYDLKTYGVSVYSDGLRRYQFELSQAEKKAESYAIASGDLQKEIDKLTNSGKKYVPVVNNTVKTTETVTQVTDAYADVLEKATDKLERQKAVQEANEKFNTDRIKNTLQKDIELVNQLYGDEKQKIIERATKQEIDKYQEKFKKEGKTEEQFFKKREEILTNWTKYALTEEVDLFNKLDEYRKQDVTKLQESYDSKEQLVKENTKNILTNTQLIQIEFEKSEAVRQAEEGKKTEEEKNKARIEARAKFADREIQLLKQNLEEQKRIAKLNLDLTLQDESKSLSEKEQAQAEYDQKVIQMAQQTADKINEINDGIKPPLPDEKTFDEQLQKSVEKISEYVDAIATAYSSLSTTIGMIQDARTEREEARIDGLYEFEKQALENQLAENIINRDEYDNKVKELDQQREQESLQLRRQEFQTNKRLNMANAVIAGAQAVLQALASSAPPINFILAALVGGLAAVQFGVISSQEFTAAGGGIVPGMGSGNVDTVPAMLAPGETVINSQSSSMYPELLNSINMAGGGISLKPDLPATNKVNPEVKFFGDNKKDSPIRAYVVETDVTDTQKRVNRIKKSAEF